MAQGFKLVLPKEALYEITSDTEDKNIIQVKSQITAANSRLESFKLSRNGDRITLSFALFTDGPKAVFDFVGERADYYRMAMGVELDETVARLLSHDKRLGLENAAADKTNVTLTLTLGKTDAARGKAAESAPVSREQEINRAYSIALETSDPAKLLEFASRYPDSPKALMARKLAEHIQSDKEYEKLGPNPDIQTLKAFIAKYPSSKRNAEIIKKIGDHDRVIADKQEAERQKRAEAEAEKQRKAAEEQTRRERAAEEKKQQESAKREKEAYGRAKGSMESLKAFLADYPDGAFTGEAKAQLSKLQKEKAEEEKALGGKQKLVAAHAAKPPAVDGDGNDAAWLSAAPIILELEPQTRRGLKTSLEARAVTSGGVLYLKLKWKDPTPDRSYRPWKWDQEKNKYSQVEVLDDALAVALFADANVDSSCMLHGQTHRTDIWLWRAFWSEISGKASDQIMVTSTERIPKSNPYLSKNGKGQVWVQNLADRGKQGWRYDIPLPSGAPAPSMPSYKPETPSGSAMDVNAAGTHREGHWTVEFSRAFDTGNDDDVAIPKNGRILASFAAFDKAEKEDHSSSPLILIEVQGR